MSRNNWYFPLGCSLNVFRKVIEASLMWIPISSDTVNAISFSILNVIKMWTLHNLSPEREIFILVKLHHFCLWRGRESDSQPSHRLYSQTNVLVIERMKRVTSIDFACFRLPTGLNAWQVDFIYELRQTLPESLIIFDQGFFCGSLFRLFPMQIRFVFVAVFLRYKSWKIIVSVCKRWRFEANCSLKCFQKESEIATYEQLIHHDSENIQVEGSANKGKLRMLLNELVCFHFFLAYYEVKRTSVAQKKTKQLSLCTSFSDNSSLTYYY